MLEDPTYDKDPGNRANNTNNLLVGFFAFSNPVHSAPPSNTVKGLLKKVIERLDVMMVLNMPKTLKIFPPGYQRGRKKRATRADETTAALFYE